MAAVVVGKMMDMKNPAIYSKNARNVGPKIPAVVRVSTEITANNMLLVCPIRSTTMLSVTRPAIDATARIAV